MGKAGWSDRKKTHAKQYAKLLQELQDAAAALKEFLNEDIHKKARHPQQLRKQLQDIDSYEEQYKAWEEQRKMYIDDMWHHQVRNEDDAHVAKTGRCCGPNRYGLIRGCQRRATDGNFCYQHAPKAYHFRR